MNYVVWKDPKKVRCNECETLGQAQTRAGGYVKDGLQAVPVVATNSGMATTKGRNLMKKTKTAKKPDTKATDNGG